MKKRNFLFLALIAVTLTMLLSGCGKKDQTLDGKYVATFELNGGTLDVKSSNVSTRINYAYEPGAYLIDPSTYGGYKLTRAGYLFNGWYTTPDCREGDKWDFAKDTINQEKLTLYAGWTRKNVYSFTVCYMNGGERVALGSYNVEEGAQFDDYRGYANQRKDFTANGFYSDPCCKQAWDQKAVHPGGATDTEIFVYVDYIPGEWAIVDSYSKLTLAINSKKNIYLTADIDCGGQALSFAQNSRDVFTAVLEGNGHTIRNFKVEQSGTTRNPTVSLFQALGEGAVIRNISFEDATLLLNDVKADTDKVTVTPMASALAKSGTGYVISNVSVSGKLVTNTQKELATVNAAFQDESGEGTIENFTANITVEKQP